MLRLLGAAAISAACMTAAYADDPPCLPTPVGMPRLADMMHEMHGQPFVVQDPAKITAFMAVANAAPPPTSYTADTVVGFIAKPGNIVFVLHHKEANTICGPLQLPPDLAAAALTLGGIARGEDA